MAAEMAEKVELNVAHSAALETATVCIRSLKAELTDLLVKHETAETAETRCAEIQNAFQASTQAGLCESHALKQRVRKAMDILTSGIKTAQVDAQRARVDGEAASAEVRRLGAALEQISLEKEELSTDTFGAEVER